MGNPATRLSRVIRNLRRSISKKSFPTASATLPVTLSTPLTTSPLIYFYTNVVGISAAMIGTIMLFSRFFDGISTY